MHKVQVDDEGGGRAWEPFTVEKENAASVDSNETGH